MEQTPPSPIDLVLLSHGRVVRLLLHSSSLHLNRLLRPHLVMIRLAGQVVHSDLLPSALLLLLVLSPRVHTVLHSVHPFSVLFHFLHDLLPLLLLLHLTHPNFTHSLLPTTVVQRHVLLRLALALLVLREHSHDLLLDRHLLLRLIPHPLSHVRQGIRIHALFQQVLVVLDHALRRSLDQLHALLLLLRVLRLTRHSRLHLQHVVRRTHRLERLARPRVGALVGVDHVGELQVALTDVLLGSGLGKHQHAERVQVLPLHMNGGGRENESVLAGEALDVLRGGHVEEHVVGDAAVLRRVDDRLEIHIDGGEELLQLLLLTDRLQSRQALLSVLSIVGHGLRLLQRRKVIGLLIVTESFNYHLRSGSLISVAKNAENGLVVWIERKSYSLQYKVTETNFARFDAVLVFFEAQIHTGLSRVALVPSGTQLNGLLSVLKSSRTVSTSEEGSRPI